nr:hypothetical protein GCM10020185_02170 [Pseudomonas brassicacearum subsp. brassicacearum]
MDIRDGEKLLQQLELGLLDAAVVYQPEYWPRLQVEQLLEEKNSSWYAWPPVPNPTCTSTGVLTSAANTTPRYRTRPRPP